MKSFLAFAILAFLTFPVFSQSVGISFDGASPNKSAALDVNVSALTEKKGLLIPRVTYHERLAMNPLPMPAQGLLVYQIDSVDGFYYNQSINDIPSWIHLSASMSTSDLNAVAGVDSSLNRTIMAFSPNGIDTVHYRDSIEIHANFESNTNHLGQKSKLLLRAQDEKYNTIDPNGKKYGRWSRHMISNNYNGPNGRRGLVFTEGYNVSRGGSQEINGEGYFQTSLETDYQRKFEWYHQLGVDQPSSGHHDTRPVMFVGNKDTLLSEWAFRTSFVHFGPIDTAMDYLNSKNGMLTIDNVPGRASASASNTIFQIKKSGKTIALTNNGANLIFSGATSNYAFDNTISPLTNATYRLGGPTANWSSLYTKAIVAGYVVADDENYTQTQLDHTINFRNITATRTLTLMFGQSPGARLQVISGQSEFPIEVVGPYRVKNAAGSPITQLSPGASFTLVWDGDDTSWHITGTSENLQGTGSYSGSFSDAVTAQATFTVGLGNAMANANYAVNITPTTSITAGNFFVTNKTVNGFDVVYLTPITGVASFDYTVSPR